MLQTNNNECTPAPVLAQWEVEGREQLEGRRREIAL